MTEHVHIVAFDVPWPADYGGVIDIFYKVKALKNLGVRVHLHCFEYGRKPANELESVCHEVHYYHRSTGKRHLLSSLPFIIATRTSDLLLKQLRADRHPILFEGLHCCALLDHPDLRDRHKVVRTHNIEHDYYGNLAKVEKDPFKRFYFQTEARKLQRFEQQLKHAQAIAAISAADTRHYAHLGLPAHHVSAFHPNDEVSIRSGMGKFCLYHGNLAVGENNQAAIYLIDKIFSGTDVPLIIAGNGATAELHTKVKGHRNIELREGISTQEIHELIADTQVNVLPTFQATGIKLKLLAALYMGRHCLVNGHMVVGTGLESLCKVENTDRRMRAAVTELMATAFTDAEVGRRKMILESDFSNRAGAERLYSLLYIPSNKH
jgi:hypothetical protein